MNSKINQCWFQRQILRSIFVIPSCLLVKCFFLSTDHWFKLVNFSRLQKLAKEAVVYMELKLKLSDDSNSESNEIFQFHIFRAVNYPISDRIN